MLGSLYTVVLDYIRKAGYEITDILKTEKRIKRERERIDKAYKKEEKNKIDGGKE